MDGNNDIFLTPNKYDFSEYRNEKGHFHRTDGPAIILRGGQYQAWVINNEYHREDGPARVWKDLPEEKHEYWLNDVQYKTKEEWTEEVIKIKLQKLKDL